MSAPAVGTPCVVLFRNGHSPAKVERVSPRGRITVSYGTGGTSTAVFRPDPLNGVHHEFKARQRYSDALRLSFDVARVEAAAAVKQRRQDANAAVHAVGCTLPRYVGGSSQSVLLDEIARLEAQLREARALVEAMEEKA